MSLDTQSFFISYSRADYAFVLRLCQDLKAAGANVWLDQVDIGLSEHWDVEIESALRGSPRLLAILSPASVASNNVMDEVSFALEEKKIVIPILYQNCEIPFRLRRLQRMDFTGEYDAALQTLISRLRLLPAHAPEPSVFATPEAPAPVVDPIALLPQFHPAVPPAAQPVVTVHPVTPVQPAPIQRPAPTPPTPPVRPIVIAPTGIAPAPISPTPVTTDPKYVAPLPGATKPNPGLAVFLAFILPGAGAAYNKQYGKGGIFFAVAIVLLVLASQASFFAVLLLLWTGYMMYDAYKVAKG